MSDDDVKDATEETEEQPAAAEESESGEKEFEFVEEPIFEVTSKGDCAYEVKVTIPVANEKKLSEETFEELKGEVELPGFRRGRAPRKLVERKFSKAVRGDVESKLVAAAFKKLIKDKDLKPIAMPDIDGLDAHTERKADEPLTFTLKFEVHPLVELGKYRGIEVERPVFLVSEADVDKAIGELQTRFSLFETAEGAEAAEGDQTIISFKGTIGGESFQGGEANNYPYIVGSKRFFPEFETVLIGAKTGETKTCEITFPEDYAVHLRGKTAQFSITINEVKRRNVPELTDEFAQQFGYENVADMRVKTAERLNAATQAQSNQIAEARLLKTIVESSTFEMPKSLVENMAHDYYEGRVEELRKEHVSAGHIQEREQDLRAAAHETALREIKDWTVVQEIAEVEGLEVNDEDFEKEAAALSRRSGASPEDVTRFMLEEGQRNRYEMRILHAKTLSHILTLAQVTDKEVGRDELNAETEKTEQADEE